MELNELPPKDGAQRAYCEPCGGPLELIFARFHDTVSGIDIDIDGIPKLECSRCGYQTLPDRSRFSIMYAHDLAIKGGSSTFISNRNKIVEEFGLTDVPFQYDSDDYYYYPGLMRSWKDGFLTPVFFSRTVLAKYDADPRYAIRYASPTYGDILADGFTIPFGINRHGHLIMWLGDIAKLPKPEQYYLLSENRPSDHCIGSEFYDGQIECIFTDPSLESVLFARRSDFLEAAFKRWNAKLAHLDAEVLDLAGTLVRPVYDTPAQRRMISDILNKVHLESIDNSRLGNLLAEMRIAAKSSGSLKRLQALLEAVGDEDEISGLLAPFYTLYDFRVAYSHLGSADSEAAKMKAVTDRLGLAQNAGLQDIYDALIAKMIASYTALAALVSVEEVPSATDDGAAAEEK
jgi:hypothetical protein